MKPSSSLGEGMDVADMPVEGSIPSPPYRRINMRYDFLCKEKKSTYEIIKDILRIITIMIICSMFIVGCYFGIRQSQIEIQESRSAFPYIAEYGDFWGGGTHEFYSYEIKDNRYIFYDKDKNLIGEFFVTENSKISIRKR